MSDAHASQPPTPSPWDERYRTNPWPAEPDPELVELVTPLAPGTALDLGCGTGRNALWLAVRGWRVIGVDSSSVGLEIAEARAREQSLAADWVLADLMTYSPQAPVDLVVMANIHPAPHERAELFTRVAAAVAPGGHLYVIGHHVEALGAAGPPDPARLYTEDTLRDAFVGLRVEQLARIDRPAEGEGPAVVDVVLWARRPSLGESS
ncbi:MAG TPA: methyltransferase domain-containing protein [Acidimicrobiales bacterium]|nr:methyltransferase domain-containing protein [Acidimicrobiales bacterium]